MEIKKGSYRNLKPIFGEDPLSVKDEREFVDFLGEG